MKAAVVFKKNDIRIADVPRPRAGPGEVVVRVMASGICATDVKILSGAGIPANLPAILGHEVAGTIVELGAGHQERRPICGPAGGCLPDCCLRRMLLLPTGTQ